MPKGRGESSARQTEALAQEPPRSRRRMRVAARGEESFVLAFADALRDILHDEPRATS